MTLLNEICIAINIGIAMFAVGFCVGDYSRQSIEKEFEELKVRENKIIELKNYFLSRK